MGSSPIFGSIVYYMIQSSHRIRLQEKRVIKKIITTLVVVVALSLISLYVGLPILAKIIVTLSSFRKGNTPVETNETVPLFPPVLNPIQEATNASKIVL